ncbi:hypothetical protein [Schlesneria paludicola]|uniref:hypothetical protein n=1 Tax=Schlesneria paludicola TaxID=360056 RepID=UPI00029A30EB|nr:hypothetical protein [Schlesneria paludicola]
MSLGPLFIMFAVNAALADKWEPPENPDPQSILTEAQADVRDKRYEIALDKFVWFHEHALEFQPAMTGVRLSFALGYWYDLGQKYPPALDKLEDARDVAARKVADGTNLVASFHDFASINRTLDEETLTQELFEVLDSQNAKAAKKVFGLAQPALVRAKAYALCAKYLEPESDFKRMKLIYNQGKKLADNPLIGKRHLDFANRKFTNEVTTLVALLAANERKPEAEEIAKQAREEWDDDTFHKDIESALEGKVPDPWP